MLAATRLPSLNATSVLSSKPPAPIQSDYRPEHITEVGSPEDIRLRKIGTTVLTGEDVEAKRKEILDYFLATYDVYEKLFEVLQDKAFYMRADPLRHPLIFYYGHTAVLYVNKLRLVNMIQRVNPHFESLFAVGVDEMSWDDLLPDTFKWPAISDVKVYRDTVRELVVQAIKTTPLKLPITWDDPFWAVILGIEHERIHLETSTVLIRQLPLDVLREHPFWNDCTFSGPAPPNELLPVINEARKVVLGKPYDHPLYGWDNEYGTQESVVPPFKASRFLVTNEEYLEFVEDGGYEKHEFWTDEGWRWVTFRRKKGSHPLFWVPVTKDKNVPVKQRFKFRTMLRIMDMPWDWPVETNYLEAKAFCNWKSAKTGKSIRLPMEDEYHVLRDHVEGDHPYWERAPGNINMEYYCSSTPVTAFPPTPQGFYDVIGNVWQHTETPIDAFRGFRVHRIYDDFSVPTFDVQHNIIAGGSWISTGNEAHRLSRYAFRRHFMQHAGFRYIETERKVVIRSNAYERDDALGMYMDAHFSRASDSFLGVPNFPRHIAQLASETALALKKNTHRALDLGCAVGRATFELARTFDYAVGLDFSVRFNRMGVQLKEQGTAKYSVVEEGDILSEHEVTLQQLNLEQVKDKVEFHQGDACNLDPRYSNYDLVLASNLIDRLYEPEAFLRMIHERIAPGGLLAISSPNTWTEEFTPRQFWLGGFKDQNGNPVYTLDSLKRILGANFRLVRGPTMAPMVLRETRQKFQHSLTEITVWEKL